ncbi:MAG: DUF3298 and DUF4163 domain-containing protein [Lachnospiraceae bacterium]|nr:DUF3298 and DUF4163 domain-containing protein [Lachnospiraceae bacterium]
MKKTLFFSLLLSFVASVLLSACKDTPAEEPLAETAPSAAASSGPEEPETALPRGPFAMTCVNKHMNITYGDFESAEGICYSFSLDEAAAKDYPKLDARIGQINDESYSEFEKRLKSASQQCLQRHMDGWEWPYESDSSATVTRADERAFSYGVCHYDYLGGAHGYTFYETAAIDPVTGEDISFFDVVKDVSDFPQICVDEIEREMPDLKPYFDEYTSDEENLKESIRNDVKRSGDGPVWSLAYDGIIMYFRDYSFGSYAAGSGTVKIPYESHREIFEKSYFEYDGSVPDTDGHVSTKEITDPATMSADSGIMTVGLDREYQSSFEKTFCFGTADCLTVTDGYPELKKRLDSDNKETVSGFNRGFADFTKEADEKYGSDTPNGGAHGYNTYELQSFVARADGAVFSYVSSRERIIADDRSRTLVGVNIDPETGKDIALDDVVADMDLFGDAVEDALNEEHYPEKTVKDVSEEIREQIGKGSLVSNEELSWTAGYEGLTIYCNNTVNFSVMDFGRDAMPLFIPYSTNEKVFKEKYTGFEGAYACQLPVSRAFGTGVMMDLDYDGKYDSIDIYPFMNDYGDADGLTFGVNGSLNKAEDFYASEISATLVKDPIGDCYIYMQCAVEDGSNTRVFGFPSGGFYEPSKDAESVGDVVYSSAYDSDDMRGYVMTDPLNFHVRRSDQVFGPRDAYAVCAVNSMGLPRSLDGTWYYRHDDLYDIKAKQEIVTGSDTIRSGTVLSPYSITPPTDMEDTADGNMYTMVLRDQKGEDHTIKLEYNEETEQFLLDGKDLQDLFDGRFGFIG